MPLTKKEKNQRYMEKVKNDPERLRVQRQKAAERGRLYRERHKDDPEYIERKEQAREKRKIKLREMRQKAKMFEEISKIEEVRPYLEKVM